MRFLPIFGVAMLAVVSASAAHADEKSDAILKEARLRAAYLKTYSVTLRPPKDPTEYMRIDVVRPDRIRIELLEEKGEKTLIVVNGTNTLLEENGKRQIVASKVVQSSISKILNYFTLTDLRFLIGKVTKTTYITQKMLDEIPVDVIDVFGTNDTKIRLYIDNNAQIRKVSGGTIDYPGGILIFENPVVDEPIPDVKFLIQKDK